MAAPSMVVMSGDAETGGGVPAAWFSVADAIELALEGDPSDYDSDIQRPATASVP